MIAPDSLRLSRLVLAIVPVLVLAGCGQGDGPQSIANRPATPLPPVPAGFCDPINFEVVCPAVEIINFNGGATTVIENPDPSGLNTSELVAQMQKFPDEVFGGTLLETGAPIDFGAGEAFTMKVWSPRSVPVLFKLEQLNIEREESHSGSGTWEELCFDFTGTTGMAANSGITLIFENGTLGQADTDPANWTFYYDDITQVDSCGGGGGGPVTFAPLTFDDPAVTYTLRGFAGAEDSSIVSDPTGGTNQVVQVNRSDTADTFAGTVVSTGANESVGTIPLDTANPLMNLRVYAPAAGIPVRLKIEDSTDPSVSVETEATTTAASAWETLTFDFANEAAGTAAYDPAANYDKIIVFFNFGTDGATAGAQTFYFDDIDVGDGGGGGGPATFSTVTFDDPAVTYTLRGFNGAEDSTVVTDPTGGTNQVVQVNRSATADTFAGTVVSTEANESVGAIPLDTANPLMNVRVYAPAAGVPVRLKIENSSDPAISVETEATTTAANAWETLTFDFANQASGTAAFDPAATYDKIVIFFNFGTDGATAGAQTFFFDDIDVGAGGGGPAGFSTITFDDPAVTYTLRGFNGAEDSTVAADPTGGTNQVLQVNRSNTADIFAGTVVSTGANESVGAIPLDTANPLMSMRVYAPAAGIPVRLKIENSGDPAISVETEATTTVANAWETLTFDFANEVSGTAAFNPAATYDKIVVFFNFGTDGATAGAQTFYADDIAVGAGGGGGGGGASSVDFESGSASFNNFEGGVSTVIANPDPSGINTSGFVAEMQKFAGQPFGGSTLDLGGVVPLADGDSYTMQVRALREVVVTFKLEPQGDERTATHSGSGTWEELCFDFTGVSGDITGITVIFDNGVVGDAAGDPDNWTFQYDDIQQTSDPCPAPPAGFTTLTFDDPAVTYTLRDFNGTASTLTNDPAGGTNTVVQVVRSDTADTFAGTVVSTEANESVGAIPFDTANPQMNVRVYSPAAGIPVRLKVENSADAAVSVETEATTTAANDWETLTFDFLNQATGTAAYDAAATYDKIVIFFNFGTDGATAGTQTFYFDDVAEGPGPASGFTAITFDDPAVTYTLRGFNGAEDSTVAADPEGGSNLVLQVNRSDTADLFAGTVVSTGANESVGAIPLDTAAPQMNVRVYAPASGIPVRLKIEDSTNAAVSVETEATTTVANGWEVLTFDFLNQVAGTPAFDAAATYDKIVIFFNFGTDGATAGAQTFYADDIDVGPGAPAFPPITFDDPAVTYTLRGFNGAEDSTVAGDPEGGSNLVLQVNRSATADLFAGTVVSTEANESVGVLPLDTANPQMNVRVYAPASGIPVRLKIEDSTNAAVSVETEATTTVANTWEVLTFSFLNQVTGTPAFDAAATYDKIVIFFNFGTDGATAGAQTFYGDDIAVGPGTP